MNENEAGETAPKSAASHYSQLAEAYDDNWSHSDEFMTWMTEEVAKRMQPSPGETIVDMGGGTGLFATRLHDFLDGTANIICVDPSAAMLDNVPESSSITTVQADAAGAPQALQERHVEGIDHILIKEAVHHFSDIDSDLQGLAELLRPGGSIAVVMLPPRIEYPLFQAALDEFERLQPHFDEVATALRRAGLDVEVHDPAFPLVISHQRYREMVRARYMSLLSGFTDDELRQGIEEMDENVPADGIQRFNDRFIFVVGRRGP